MDDSQPLHPAIRGLKTVCRCNNIKYRTIEKAIREGAHTVAAVAAKTGATTGHCGGSCTPDVQAMLEEHAPGSGTPAGAAKGAQTGVSVPQGQTGVSVPQNSGDNQAPADKAANANAWWVRKS